MANHNKVVDSLQQQQRLFENQQIATKAFKNFYKGELDNMMNQKNKQKLLQKEKEIEDRKKFNERCQQGKQLQKLKDLSYRNYYQMIMNGQQNHIENYVSPFSKRDSMKLQHINIAVEQQRKRAQQQQLQRQRRLSDMKNSYKKGLQQQLEEKKYLQNQRRFQREKQKQSFQKIAKLPQDIEEWEKQRKKQQMSRYKEDLDKVRYDKEIRKTQQNKGRFYDPQVNHNPVTNPLPYNIQNPYILKQMQKTSLIKNSSYLANIGNSNLNEVK